MDGNNEIPDFRTLDPSEIETILSRNNVGRIGYVRDNRMEIQPVHYVYSDGWIYGRTSYGAKYKALGETAYQWWPVIFEVDEVDDLFSWRSVVVHGGFYVLREEGTQAEKEIWAKALDLLRSLVPATLRDNDPVPFRNILFRMAVQEATGREAVPSADH
jgi:nitroimidazol reductase NimA-like FMN-containing flavoprotein (pyridoxamine 5'-phosphate oxidase superfamily)